MLYPADEERGLDPRDDPTRGGGDRGLRDPLRRRGAADHGRPVDVSIALITYASRAAALVFLPAPEGRFGAILGRMPAPIFSSLAMLTLVTDDRSLAGGPVLCAAAGALILSPKRSLPLCLIGGVVGYALAVLLIS